MHVPHSSVRPRHAARLCHAHCHAAAPLQENNYPNGGDGLWGNDGEAPSFLYAMPLGGKRVFLEETCLVAKPALPFAGETVVEGSAVPCAQTSCGADAEGTKQGPSHLT